MKPQATVFSQLLDLVPRYQFQKIVNEYNGDKKCHKLDCWSQFCAIFYSQLRQQDSLRGITEGLDAQLNKLYHLGMKPVKRSTFSDANNKRDYRIYEQLFNFLNKKCHSLSQNQLGLSDAIHTIDASVIDLCYSLYPWAKYRTRKGAIKLHLHLSNESYLPEAVVLTEGNVHEINIARNIPIKPDSIYVMDRGYLDYEWLYSIHQRGGKFVIRAKKDMSYSEIGQHAIDSPENPVLADSDIRVPWRHKTQPSLKPKYPEPLRMITYQDQDTGKIYRFLTNIEDFKPETIALIYKQRWQIELFFKWIKQHLKIKSFIGTSKNAVFTQIWIAMIVYLILWYLKHQINFKKPLLTLTRLISETFFERVSIFDILNIPDPNPKSIQTVIQLTMGFV